MNLAIAVRWGVKIYYKLDLINLYGNVVTVCDPVGI